MKTRAGTPLLLLLLSLVSLSNRTEQARTPNKNGRLNSYRKDTLPNQHANIREQHPLTNSARQRLASKMKRELYLEKLENPNYNELFAGKRGIDHEYMRMIDDQKSMEDKLHKQEAGLYQEYRRFEGRKADMRKKRNAKLKSVLQAATMDNFFTTDPEQYAAGGESLKISGGGLSLEGVNKRRTERLMGMSDLDDLKHLDINKELSRRIKRVGRPAHTHRIQERGFNTPRERRLSLKRPQATQNKRKRPKATVHPSYLVRNGNAKNKFADSTYKPVKRLVRDTEHRLRNSSFTPTNIKPIIQKKVSLKPKTVSLKPKTVLLKTTAENTITPKARGLMMGSSFAPGYEEPNGPPGFVQPLIGPLTKSQNTNSRKLFKKKMGMMKKGAKMPNMNIKVPKISSKAKPKPPGANPVLLREIQILKAKKLNKRKFGKIASMKKKFKTEMIYSWTKMKWISRTHYSFQLLDSIRETPFWRKMGFRIKNKKKKLKDTYDLFRPKKTSQIQCMLFAKFDKLMIYNMIGEMFLKINFRSNCFQSELVKVFRGPNKDLQTFRIYIGTLGFTLTYNKFWEETKGYYKKVKPYYYLYTTNRKYSLLRLFPSFSDSTFDPWRNKSNLLKTGLVPKSAAKWSGGRIAFFKEYQLAYPLRSYSEAKKHVKVLRKKYKAKRKHHEKLKQRLEKLDRMERERKRKIRYGITHKKRGRSSRGGRSRGGRGRGGRSRGGRGRGRRLGNRKSKGGSKRKHKDDLKLDHDRHLGSKGNRKQAKHIAKKVSEGPAAKRFNNPHKSQIRQYKMDNRRTPEQRMLKLKTRRKSKHKKQHITVRSSDFASEHTPGQIQRAVNMSAVASPVRQVSYLAPVPLMRNGSQLYQIQTTNQISRGIPQITPKPQLRLLSSPSTRKTRKLKLKSTKAKKASRANRKLRSRGSARGQGRGRGQGLPRPKFGVANPHWKLRYQYDKKSKFFIDAFWRKIRVNTYTKPKIVIDKYKVAMGGFIHYEKLGYHLLPASTTQAWVSGDVVEKLWKSADKPATCTGGLYFTCKV